MSRNNAGLDTERIVAEALHIIDGQGLRRLTMRRLGDALGVEAMAVYHHFPLGKEQLFAAIVEHVTRTPALPALPESGQADEEHDEPEERPEEAEEQRPWDERLRDWATRHRERLLAHAGALPLVINRRPDSAHILRLHDWQHAAFAEAGLDREQCAAAVAALDSYVMGSALHQVRAESPHGITPATLDGSAGPSGQAEDHDARFRSGLDALLAGLTGRS